METNDSEVQPVRTEALRKLDELCVGLGEVEHGGKIVDITQTLLGNALVALELVDIEEIVDERVLAGLVEALETVTTTVPDQTNFNKLKAHLGTLTDWHDRRHTLVKSEIETLRTAAGLLATVHQGLYTSKDEHVQRVVGGIQFNNRVNRVHYLATH